MPSSRLSLLIVADSTDGGLGAAAAEHARWFAGQGWSVVLAAPRASDREVGAAETRDLPVPAGAADVVGMVAAARALRSLIGSRRPQTVHAHGTRSQLIVLMTGRVPWVTMHGGGRVEGQGGLGALVRRIGRWAASWLAAGAFSAAPASGRWRTLLHASPRLTGLEAADPARMAAVPTFLWVGRLDAPKQPELFVRACAIAAEQRPLRGLVLGDGPRLEGVRELARRLEAPVEVDGARPDVAPAIAESWAVCLFSDFEGVPFAVQEAMWSARAVLLSPLPTLRWFADEAAMYAVDEQAAAAHLLALCDRDVAIAAGARASARIRGLLVEGAPYPQLMDAYGRR